MPELPEVEIISTGLNSFLTGRIVSSVQTGYPGCIHGWSRDLQTGLSQRVVQGVRRRAKLAIIDLDQELRLLFHLKMTGKLVFDPEANLGVDKHTHLIINFTDRTRLLFRDLRKFGYCLLLYEHELKHWPFYQKLGPEPLQMNHEEFNQRLKTRKAGVKSVLLNQEAIAGIGNIYADEALHLAKIHPAQSCADIPEEQLSRLFQALQEVLEKAITLGGATFSDYVNSLGKPGSFQEQFMVYGRRGHSCRACQTALTSQKVSGRTSVFCPCCQPFG